MSAELEPVLIIKTVQIAPIRTLMTALKDIIMETNISFTPQGMRLITMDKSHTILVNMNLLAENFELFECKKPKIIIGLNVLHLFKLINTIDNDDTLTIYIDKADYTDGIVSYLGLKFENNKQCKTQKLRLLEPDGEELFYPNVTFSSIINLPSADFQKIIRDLTGLTRLKSNRWPTN
jgi:proliferating cell nuclear antigen